jgi:regulatory protein
MRKNGSERVFDSEVNSQAELKKEIQNKAVCYLSRREYSRNELVEKIRRFLSKSNKAGRGCSSRGGETGCFSEGLPDGEGFDTIGHLIEDVIDQMQELGLQSDVRYAEMLVRSRVQRGYGPQKILQELRQKKVFQPESYLVQTRIEDVLSGGCWSAQAEQVRVKKFGKQKPVSLQQKSKQLRFLRYRGFPSEMVNDLL